VVPGFMMAVMFLAYIVVRLEARPIAGAAFDPVPTQGWARWGPLVMYVTPLVRSS
jgi:hypothetical protein